MEQKAPSQEILEKISEYIAPEMAEIWKTFFSNYESDKIIEWKFSDNTGFFSIRLKSPMKLWVPASKASSSEPRPGSILIFGLNNKVEGRLNYEKKSIEFQKGFQIFCKYKLGFLKVPIMVEVYSFSYKNRDSIILEAGKGGMSEKRSRPLEKYLLSWGQKDHVVYGDHENYLNQKSK